MVAAAEAIVLDLAIIERRAAVAAAGGREADAFASVAKQDQVLARCANSSGMAVASDAIPLSPTEVVVLLAQIDRLTERAEDMLAAEKNLS